VRPVGVSKLHGTASQFAKAAAANPQIKKKVKMTDKEFAEKAEPVLVMKPRVQDLELPDLIETPLGIRKVSEGPNGDLVLGEMVFDFPDDTDLALSGDIRKLDNVAYRKKVSRFVKRMGEAHKIFSSPNVNGFQPRINLVVEYPAEQLVYWGVEYGPKMVATKPKVTWNSYLSNRMWTLVMLGQGLDNPKIAYDHWIVGNIPGASIEGGQTIADYIPASPFKDGDLHRYTFVLLSQPGTIDFKGLSRGNDLAQRSDFNIRTFIKDHNLRAKGLSWFYSKARADIPGFYERLNLGFETDVGEDDAESFDFKELLESRKRK
jgi:hypothetical protein